MQDGFLADVAILIKFDITISGPCLTLIGKSFFLLVKKMLSIPNPARGPGSTMLRASSQ